MTVRRRSSSETAREVAGLQDGVDAGEADRDTDSMGMIAAYEALVAHPCTAHHGDLPGALVELGELYARKGRFDDAIGTRYRAIEAGLRSEPDGRAEVAEWLIASGRRREGDEMYALLRAAEPDNVWVYNAAVFAYQRVDDTEALRWALDGIDVAFGTGDPGQLVTQLADFAVQAWDALGLGHDAELLTRIDAFVAAWKRPPLRPSKWEPVIEVACEHCDFTPDHRAPLVSGGAAPLVGSGSAGGRFGVVSNPAKRTAFAVAWFSTPADWAAACTRWPELGADHGTDHQRYSHSIEARIKDLARNAPAGQRFTVAPLAWDDIEQATEELMMDGTDDGDVGDQARAAAAGRCAVHGRAITWPPERNAPCWCGSGRKYKQCCGPVPPR